MSEVKCQKTLGYFKFIKITRHREMEVNLEIPNELENDSETVLCDICKNTFQRLRLRETQT